MPKVAAYLADPSDRDRHLFDAAALLACIEDPFVEREQFAGSDGRCLRRLARALPAGHPAWLALTGADRDEAQAALDVRPMVSTDDRLHIDHARASDPWRYIGRMMSGVVRNWDRDEGWGVIDSPETPGGCWAIFAVIEMPGLKTLTAGDRVDFEWVTPGQDGFAYAATRVVPLSPVSD